MNWNNGVIRPSVSFKETFATNPGIPLGAIAYDYKGNKYRFGKAKSTIISAGKLLTQNLAGVAAITDLASYSVTTPSLGAPVVVKLTDNTAVTLTANELAGAIIYISGGGTAAASEAGQMAYIKEHAAFTDAAPTFYLDEAFATTLDTTNNDNDGSILMPYWVDPTAVDVQQSVKGVSVGAVTDEYFFWMLTSGIGLVATTASQTAGRTVTAGGATITGHGLCTVAATEYQRDIARVLVAAAQTYVANTYLNLCEIFCETA